MLYLRNTTTSQIAFVPKCGRAVVGSLTFALITTIDKVTVHSATVIDLATSRNYYDIALTLPSGLGDGEYQYTLSDGCGVLSSGLAKVSGGEPSVTEYNKSVTYKQYGQ